MTITFKNNVNIIYHLSVGVIRRVITPFIYKETVTFAKRIAYANFRRDFQSEISLLPSYIS